MSRESPLHAPQPCQSGQFAHIEKYMIMMYRRSSELLSGSTDRSVSSSHPTLRGLGCEERLASSVSAVRQRRRLVTHMKNLGQPTFATRLPLTPRAGWSRWPRRGQLSASELAAPQPWARCSSPSGPSPAGCSYIIGVGKSRLKPTFYERHRATFRSQPIWTIPMEQAGPYGPSASVSLLRTPETDFHVWVKPTFSGKGHILQL